MATNQPHFHDTSESSSDESTSCATSSGRCAVRYVGSTRRLKPDEQGMMLMTSSHSAPNMLVPLIHTNDNVGIVDNPYDSVTDYLDQNPNFLENYLMKRWTLEKLEHFLRRSLSPAVSESSSGNNYLRTPSKLSPNGGTNGNKIRRVPVQLPFLAFPSHRKIRTRKNTFSGFSPFPLCPVFRPSCSFSCAVRLALVDSGHIYSLSKMSRFYQHLL